MVIAMFHSTFWVHENNDIILCDITALNLLTINNKNTVVVIRRDIKRNCRVDTD